ncbi:HNH endonuclease [Vibrio sp. nBUS_14]|uniref:HNH endonuclease n=1 Tax=Vibrio sp. nBUS_14 TaxID=3395321 RepID=UPI003EBA9644
MKKKLARICWNSNGWKSPSGPDYKSKDPNSFECKYGYGHEEWLADMTKEISGYKYAFLQPINTPLKSHQGKEYEIWLFTIKNSEKLCIGKINQIYCLTEKEAIYAVEQYRKKGWHQEMCSQLERLSISAVNFTEENALNNFNIKFKPEDIEWFSEPIHITDQYNCTRYNLLNMHSDIKGIIAEDSDDLAIDLLDIGSSALSDSEKETLVTARIGQGKFRRNVIDTWGGENCAVTLTNTREMLVASHIKAWKDCETTDERLDGANGILLCSHIDRLFDCHLVTFKLKRSEYFLEISKSLDQKELTRLGIGKGIELNTAMLKPEDEKRLKEYMDYHNHIYSVKEEQRKYR